MGVGFGVGVEVGVGVGVVVGPGVDVGAGMSSEGTDGSVGAVVGVDIGSGAIVPSPESPVQAAMLRRAMQKSMERAIARESLKRIFILLQLAEVQRVDYIKVDAQ